MQRCFSSEKLICGSAVAKAYTGYVSYCPYAFWATKGKCRKTQARESVLQDSTFTSKDAPKHAIAQGRADIWDANSCESETVEKITLFDASKIVNVRTDDW